MVENNSNQWKAETKWGSKLNENTLSTKNRILFEIGITRVLHTNARFSRMYLSKFSSVAHSLDLHFTSSQEDWICLLINGVNKMSLLEK